MLVKHDDPSYYEVQQITIKYKGHKVIDLGIIENAS